ncbi:PEP-CTERM sorting domain-containing protein [Roseateles sp. BYS78W]|uniref:PEP-CTERM sorting domain-containing protein n=1 Tax=Pelomonas candidula TaxID=3299025 RepID=A0ABW7HCL1_9BURK
MASKRLFSFRGWVIAMAGLAGMPLAHAGLVNIDFNSGAAVGTYSGAAVTGAAGDLWNGVDGGSLSAPTDSSNVPLLDAAGASTGITLSFAGTGGAFDATGNGCLMSTSSFAPLMCDYLYRSLRADASVTLAGLTPGAAYDLILYASANTDGRITEFTLDGITQSVTAAAATGFALGTNYAEFKGVVAATGLLSFTFTGPSEGNLDGLQLTQTGGNAVTLPEPATIALLALGLGTVAWLRGKRAGATRL